VTFGLEGGEGAVTFCIFYVVDDVINKGGILSEVAEFS
jgi:hypothetical protein